MTFHQVAPLLVTLFGLVIAPDDSRHVAAFGEDFVCALLVDLAGACVTVTWAHRTGCIHWITGVVFRGHDVIAVDRGGIISVSPAGGVTRGSLPIGLHVGVLSAGAIGRDGIVACGTFFGEIIVHNSSDARVVTAGEDGVVVV